MYIYIVLLSFTCLHVVFPGFLFAAVFERISCGIFIIISTHLKSFEGFLMLLLLLLLIIIMLIVIAFPHECNAMFYGYEAISSFKHKRAMSHKSLVHITVFCRLLLAFNIIRVMSSLI